MFFILEFFEYENPLTIDELSSLKEEDYKQISNSRFKNLVYVETYFIYVDLFQYHRDYYKNIFTIYESDLKIKILNCRRFLNNYHNYTKLNIPSKKLKKEAIKRIEDDIKMDEQKILILMTSFNSQIDVLKQQILKYKDNIQSSFNEIHNILTKMSENIKKQTDNHSSFSVGVSCIIQANVTIDLNNMIDILYQEFKGKDLDYILNKLREIITNAKRKVLIEMNIHEDIIAELLENDNVQLLKSWADFFTQENNEELKRNFNVCSKNMDIYKNLMKHSDLLLKYNTDIISTNSKVNLEE